jgi:predicted regulator of Ras-like GTPase activity (Roadblock/LC7/MglB family)
VIQHGTTFDWMLKELAEGVPGIHQVVVLSTDGLRIAGHGGTPAAADRIAATSSGLQSLAGAIAGHLPGGDGQVRMVVIEISSGYFYLMAAGTGAYLAVLAAESADAGLVTHRMHDLVIRMGPHLTSPPRRDGQTA